ncbi:hypothetical protein L195_g000473 [Trifolium pratense]|uniref:Uncharacterized protein n=1 Tax=Trifolium pratense TaxID=57577 RepID=A0A2K3NLY6_TRIPR|nr:hypothetical protein L195_g000473 [Trifolium pratense]
MERLETRRPFEGTDGDGVTQTTIRPNQNDNSGEGRQANNEGGVRGHRERKGESDYGIVIELLWEGETKLSSFWMVDKDSRISWTRTSL